jgi:hypothetical protein
MSHRLILMPGFQWRQSRRAEGLIPASARELPPKITPLTLSEHGNINLIGLDYIINPVPRNIYYQL